MARANTLFVCCVGMLIISACAAANLLSNPSFEFSTSSSLGWTKYHQGYGIDSSTAHSGTSSINCTSLSKTLTYGAYQYIRPSSSTPILSPITISAYGLIAPNATGNGGFGFFAHVQCTNGTWLNDTNVLLSNTVYTWQYRTVTLNIASPVKQVWVYLVFSNLKGTVWFDDVSVLAELAATTAAPTPTPTNTTTTAAPSYLVVGLRYLIVSSSMEDSRLLAASKTLDSVGAQYDVAIVSVNNTTLSLTAPDGSGKYIGIITTDDLIPSASELQINNYQLTFNVRWVVMYAFPSAQDGVALAGSSPGTPASLSFSSAASSYTSGYAVGASFSTGNAWMYPASITSSIATPALNLAIGLNSYVGAVFVARADGTQRLVFFVDQSPYHIHAIGLGSFWLQWISNNFYLGLRRVYLNCHADDLFMASDLWDTSKGEEDFTGSYRINATELQDFADFQTTLNARLPAGSNITISFPFNGLGVKEQGGYLKDKLFNKTRDLINNFVFQTHTYTHPELNNLTYAQTTNELKNNFNLTLELFGSFQHPSYANRSMVTPSISGLFNPNALRALWNVGIRAVVGDNTRVELRTPFPYHGFYTTNATNGFVGMYIMPREATEIYYDCSNIEEEVSEYNHYYQTYFGYNSTFEQIIQREVDRVSAIMLAFRYDSYMFHQVNLHEFWYNGRAQSLLSIWIDAVMTQFSQYYSLPVYSHNQDFLTQKWLDRDARDACGFDGKVYLNPTTKQIVKVSGTTSKSCNIAFTGLDVPSSATVKTELYGVDKTVWVSAKANTPFTLTLNTPIQL